MKRILRRFKENIEEKEEEMAKQELLDYDWIDPSPDLYEGIFHVN